MSFGIPSWSDVKNAASSAVKAVDHTAAAATAGARELGTSALHQAASLGREGLDLGRHAVAAVRSVDVREAASTVRHAIGTGVDAARSGIKTGVEWAGHQEHVAADFARAHVPGGDNVVSNAIRGAITVEENVSRFSLGVVGGVAREGVGLVGTVGQLATTGVEMQLSPEAAKENATKLLHGAEHAVQSAGHYATSVAHDPSRLGSDVSHVAGDVKDWGSGQIHRYEQAFRDGKGPETVGMDVGAVATYVVPIGGGPVRGALTLLGRDAGEAVVRGSGEALIRESGGVAAREGAEAATRGAADAGGGLKALDGLADLARRTGSSEAKLQEVIDLGRGNRPPPSSYLSAERIGENRAAFSEGASRFALQDNVEKWGLGQRDGTTFVMTRADADAIMRTSGGDPRELEAALGLPRGQLDAQALVRVDFPPEVLDDLGIRMPSGNEAGANEQWLPGGFLPSGANEAVIDGAKARADQYSIHAVR